MSYGLTEKTDIRNMAILVCECLGYGTNKKAVDLLVETAVAETQAGATADLSEGAGMGLMQFDKKPFQDVKDRCRKEDKSRIQNSFDIDVDLVDWQSLRYNPLLSMIFARLKYKKIPAEIPSTMEERALYWKIHYNSLKGKGTTDHYLISNLNYIRGLHGK